MVADFVDTYGIKTKKWRQAHCNQDVLNSGSVCCTVIVCAVACIIRYLVSLAYMNVGFNHYTNELCDSLSDASYVSYAFVICAGASFLWSRQRAFYAHRLLNANYNKGIIFLSFISIAFIVGYGIFAVVLNTLPSNHVATGQGCIREIESNDNNKMNWVAAAAGTAFYNLILLGLLSYALTHTGMQGHNTENPNNTVNAKKRVHSEQESSVLSEQCSSYSHCQSTSVSNIKSHTKRSSTAKIRFILKKTVIFAVISILVDVVLQVFSNYIENFSGHRRYINLVFDVSTFLNLVFVIFSFAVYKEMMTSPSGNTFNMTFSLQKF